MANEKDLELEIMDRITPFSGPIPKAENGMEMLASGHSMQKVQTPYTTAVAVQRPRKISVVAQNVYEEAELAGRSFYYGWDVMDKRTGKKTHIEGPSIDLAMCIARNYGNSAIDIQAEETPTHYMIKGVFIDLETGFTAPRLFRQRKSQSMGEGMNAERQEDIVFQIGQSKAIRNAIIKTMPAWLIEKAIEKAKSKEGQNIINLKSAIAEAITYFGEKEVSKERLEAYIGRESDQWLKSDIVNLKGVATALQEGRVSALEVFPEPVKEVPVAAPAPEKKAEPPATSRTTGNDSKQPPAATSEKAAPAVKKESATQAPEQSQAPVDNTPPFDPDPEKTTQASQNKAYAETKGRTYTAPAAEKKTAPAPTKTRDEAETQDFLRTVSGIKEDMPAAEFRKILDFYGVEVPEQITDIDNRISFIKDCMKAMKDLEKTAAAEPPAPAQASVKHGFVTCPMTKETFTKSTCDMTMCDRRGTCPEFNR